MEPQDLHNYLSADFQSGVLTWLPRAGQKIFNTRYAGTVALNHSDEKGYKRGLLLYRPYKAHRVIYAMYHGEWPIEIDHIDGNPANNSIDNLRDVGRVGNLRNMPKQSRNKTGCTGVKMDPRRKRKKWLARIGVDGKTVHVGSFSCYTAAMIARKRAEIQIGFHPNHGRHK
jgi:hypothetical protein